MMKDGLQLNLGCFDQVFEGWYNCDVSPHLFVARVPLLPRFLHSLGVLDEERYAQYRAGIFRRIHYVDLRKPLPFRTDSVQACFCSHVLEHLYFFHAERLLAEIHRVLLPGGFVRIVVPNLAHAMTLYREEDPNAFLSKVFENERMTLEKNQHRWMFTSPSLIRALKAAGFETAKQVSYHETQHAAFMPLDNRPEGSLFVEGKKGGGNSAGRIHPR